MRSISQQTPVARAKVSGNLASRSTRKGLYFSHLIVWGCLPAMSKGRLLGQFPPFEAVSATRQAHLLQGRMVAKAAATKTHHQDTTTGPPSRTVAAPILPCAPASTPGNYLLGPCS